MQSSYLPVTSMGLARLCGESHSPATTTNNSSIGNSILSITTMATQPPPFYCPFPPPLAEDRVQRSIQSNKGNATSSFLLSFSSYSATIYLEQQWQRNLLLLIFLFLLLLLKTGCNDLSRATMATQPPPSYCPFPPTLQRSI